MSRVRYVFDTSRLTSEELELQLELELPDEYEEWQSCASWFEEGRMARRGAPS